MLNSFQPCSCPSQRGSCVQAKKPFMNDGGRKSERTRYRDNSSGSCHACVHKTGIGPILLLSSLQLPRAMTTEREKKYTTGSVNQLGTAAQVLIKLGKVETKTLPLTGLLRVCSMLLAPFKKKKNC